MAGLNPHEQSGRGMLSESALCGRPTASSSRPVEDLALLRHSKRRRLSSNQTEGPLHKAPTKAGSSLSSSMRSTTTAYRIGSPDLPFKSGRTRFSPESELSGKMKLSDSQEAPKRSRRAMASPAVDSTPPKPGSSPSADGSNTTLNIFRGNYEEMEKLGQGGFGAVFAGRRRKDGLPVAIKHIPLYKMVTVCSGGRHCTLPLEVFLMLKSSSPCSPGTSAVVSLLDWYVLEEELVLVLERPPACMDLIDYMAKVGLHLTEWEAKLIVKQLVAALIEVHSRGVFHRDIKPENILIQSGSDGPRVRIIDLGCGKLLSKEPYRESPGTDLYSCPEWFQRGWYHAEPATVWQLGVTLFTVLHGSFPFMCAKEIVHAAPSLRDNLTTMCEDFVLSCLRKCPDSRPTLEKLLHHPWLA